MQLDEFVKTTLMQITKGVKDAQAEAAEYGAVINPLTGDRRLLKVTEVSFDVALTVSEANAGEVGGGLRVFPFLRMDGKATETDMIQQTSRVQFQLRMTLPCTESIRPSEPDVA